MNKEFDEAAYEAAIGKGEKHDVAVKRAFGEEVKKKPTLKIKK